MPNRLEMIEYIISETKREIGIDPTSRLQLLNDQEIALEYKFLFTTQHWN